MQDAIILNTKDVKQILAKYFNVDPKNVVKSQYSWTIIKDDEESEKK